LPKEGSSYFIHIINHCFVREIHRHVINGRVGQTRIYHPFIVAWNGNSSSCKMPAASWTGRIEGIVAASKGTEDGESSDRGGSGRSNF
jgi:hypothetical protein